MAAQSQRCRWSATPGRSICEMGEPGHQRPYHLSVNGPRRRNGAASPERTDLSLHADGNDDGELDAAGRHEDGRPALQAASRFRRHRENRGPHSGGENADDYHRGGGTRPGRLRRPDRAGRLDGDTGRGRPRHEPRQFSQEPPPLSRRRQSRRAPEAGGSDHRAGKPCSLLSGTHRSGEFHDRGHQRQPAQDLHGLSGPPCRPLPRRRCRLLAAAADEGVDRRRRRRNAIR